MKRKADEPVHADRIVSFFHACRTVRFIVCYLPKLIVCLFFPEMV